MLLSNFEHYIHLLYVVFCDLKFEDASIANF